MSIFKILKENYLFSEAKFLSTGREEQINKIKHYRDTDDMYNVCHAHTGKAIKNNPDSYVVLCGFDKDTIAHSFAVDKTGKNLIPGDKSNIDMNNPTTCTVIHSNKLLEFPYAELINASEL